MDADFSLKSNIQPVEVVYDEVCFTLDFESNPLYVDADFSLKSNLLVLII